MHERGNGGCRCKLNHMGMFNVQIRISNPSGGNETEFDALVDTGAFLTMAPEPALRNLGLTPTRTVEFELADGSVRRLRRR